MSIVSMELATVAGLSAEKERVLSELRDHGCLELVPFRPDDSRPTASQPVTEGPSSKARQALKFLLTCPQHRRQVRDDPTFDSASVERAALDVQRRIAELEAERDGLAQRLVDAEPWGTFRFPEPGELGDLRLWFYQVPRKTMAAVHASGLPWQVVRRKGDLFYVVVIHETEPTAMPVPRVHLGSLSPDDAKKRLEQVELELDDAQAERFSLTRWCHLFARNLSQLEDAAALVHATQHTCDRDPVFAVQGWVPAEHIPRLTEYARKEHLLFESRPPLPGENPPTFMRNPPRLAAGEDLVTFYMTPSYWTWDPSIAVLISFAIFFAMILADAGYAAILGVALLLGWRRLGQSPAGRRFRPMLGLITAVSLAYGVVIGSYFGVVPAEGTALSRLHILDVANTKLMMGLSILIGGVHVVLANLLEARSHRRWIDGLASIGWALAVTGGLLFAAAAAVPTLPVPGAVGVGASALGLLLVVGFTAPHEKPLKRALQGLLGLTKISGAFGDILSYLRLFALGLASASLATAFNEMAAGIQDGAPRIGLLLALLVLAFGHALNLLLGVSSGVIHGLRLNVIEFFNWGLKDEGRRFTPFRHTEDSLWK